MCHVFNADDGDIPFFRSVALPEAQLSFSWAHSEAHVPGRHLNALLNAEDAAGVLLDEACVENQARAAFFSYSGAVPLPLNRDQIGGPLLHFLPHNVREGFHALVALARFRQSEPARRLAEASIAAIRRYWDSERGWDIPRLESDAGVKVTDQTYIAGLARAMGPLVKLYRATRHAPALDLALILKEKALNEYFGPDGRYDVARFGPHAHSVTCVLSSLAQLADLLGDAALLERVRTFYDAGLWDLRDALGWSPESAAPEANPDRGEGNNTGDIIETALILGRWGYPQYYGDAERMLRGHLLPAQLRDASFIREPDNPAGADGKRDLAQRHRGAWGMPAPYGHIPLEPTPIIFNMDIVGGVTASLCEVCREATRYDAAGHWVNLFFDHQTDAIQVESPYTRPALRLRLKRPGPLFVRTPAWMAGQPVEVEGLRQPPRPVAGYWFVAEPPVNRPIAFHISLPLHDITLKHRTRAIRARLRGDEVIAMQNFGADLTFFDDLDG
jgi:hypothetical protein